jgi:excinuclease ABC subunit A
VACDVCHGKRYNRETLEVRYKGKNIAEVLDMTIEDAREFFDAVPVIARKLQTMMDVGLTYVRLGQAATTLSGGEAQRVKLSRELSKRDTGQTLYILDEPTTGLHFEDIRQLLAVLHQLRDQGNTIVVIEHNLDVIKTADWIIDLGPEGGSGGGVIVAEGTPEAVASCEGSHTGFYLKRMIG